VVERLQPTEKEPQHLCLDADYDNQVSRDTVKEHHYQGHIHPARGPLLAGGGTEIPTSLLSRSKNFWLAPEVSGTAGAR
jgi:hypothetical protein